MNEETMRQLTGEQQHMGRAAMRLVIYMSILIHILLNVYAMMGDDSFLKVAIPVMSVISVVVVALIMRTSDDH